MSKKYTKEYDLLDMINSNLMSEGDKVLLNLLERAKNNPELQQKLTDFIEREFGTDVSNADFCNPEKIVEHWRKCLALGILERTPKEKMN